MTATRLVGTDLSIGYERRSVVEGVTLRVEPGRVTALVGPNGSGKSTLLRALARLHRPSSGRVGVAEVVDGVAAEETDASALSAREFARRVAMLTQSRPQPSGLSVREVVAFGRHPHRQRFAGLDADDIAAVRRAMRMTGVALMADRAVDELSGGELQRVWLATCLAQEAGVLLLDEPTNHLDLRYQMETLELLRELADDHGVAVGVVLHDLGHAAAVADAVVLLADGRVRASGDPDAVLTAEHLGEVYGVPIDARRDAETGVLRIEPQSARLVARRTTADAVRELRVPRRQADVAPERDARVPDPARALAG